MVIWWGGNVLLGIFLLMLPLIILYECSDTIKKWNRSNPHRSGVWFLYENTRYVTIPALILTIFSAAKPISFLFLFIYLVFICLFLYRCYIEFSEKDGIATVVMVVFLAFFSFSLSVTTYMMYIKSLNH